MTKQLFISLVLILGCAQSGLAMKEPEKQTLNEQLITAIESKNTDRLKELIKAGANVNCTNKHGWSALMRSATKEGSNSFRILLDAGADVNTVLEHRNTELQAIMIASNYKHEDAVNGMIPHMLYTPTQEAIAESHLRVRAVIITLGRLPYGLPKDVIHLILAQLPLDIAHLVRARMPNIKRFPVLLLTAAQNEFPRLTIEQIRRRMLAYLENSTCPEASGGYLCPETLDEKYGTMIHEGITARFEKLLKNE